MVTHFGIGNVPTHVSAFEDSTVLVNPLDLQLVFGNLIKNAKEAAAQQTDESPQLLVKAQVMEGFICIELEDNGPPLSDRELAGLNEVVTSAKPDGLGLGLSISRNIVEGVGGNIVFKRRFRNTGLRTCVKLPVSAGTVKPLGD